jgi:hypothetical protein
MFQDIWPKKKLVARYWARMEYTTLKLRLCEGVVITKLSC